MHFPKVIPVHFTFLSIMLLLLLQANGGQVLAQQDGLDPATAAALASLTITNSSVPIQYPEPPVEYFDPISPATSESTGLINLDDFRSDVRFNGIDGSGVAIVVLDTGIDLDHAFFGPDVDMNNVADRIVYHYDFADGDADATDVNGHGSNVTSIVASSDATYTGMAPGADIIHLKVFTNAGSGNFSYVESALTWVVTNAVAYNIVSVNMSLGDSQNYATAQTLYGVDDEMAALAALGVTVVSSSGNDFFSFSSVQGVGYPAADPNSFSIGAVYDANVGGFAYSSGAQAFSSDADRLTPFSQRHSTLSTIFAPGAPSTGAGPTGGLVTMHGTSQSAPHITGIVALMQELALQHLGRLLTVAEVESLMVSTAVLINDGDDENDNVTNTTLNFPRVDVFALGEAILALNDTIPPQVSQLNSSADSGDGSLDANEATNAAISQLIVTFNEEIYDPVGNGDADDVTNPANYVLVTDGVNGSFDTAVCGPAQGDDGSISVDNIDYNNATYTATLTINSGIPLSEDQYRFIICGSTIKDSSDNALDGNGDGSGGDDFSRDFEIDTSPPLVSEIMFGNLMTSTVVTLTTYVTTLAIAYPEPMNDSGAFFVAALSNSGGGGQVTNPNNYLLFNDGPNDLFDTSSCGTVQGDDDPIVIDAVAYDEATRSATLSFNGGNALDDETYFVMGCGSLADRAGNAIGTDFGVAFAVDLARLYLPVVANE